MKGLFLRRGQWHYQPRMIAGRRPDYINLHTASEREAEIRALGLARADRIDRDPGRMTMQVIRYLDSRSLRPATRTTHKAVLDLAATFWGDPLVSAISRRDVTAWEASLSGCAESTRSNYLARLATFLRWCERDGQFFLSPMHDWKVKTPKATRIHRFCSTAQREALIAAATHPPTRLVLMLGFFAGLRVAEIAAGRMDWIRLWDGGGEIVVQASGDFIPKDKEARSVPVGARLRDTLAGVEPVDAEGHLFLGRNHGRNRYDPHWSLKRLGASCGVPWFSAHVMRRTFATLHVMAGTPIHLVARWLGDDLKTAHRNYFGYAGGQEHAGRID